jgi:uncharacterized membrane-anchored protein YitT (DUF2179 family)
MVIAGIFLIAWSFNAILAANHIMTGGLAGLSLLLKLQLNIDPSLTQWALGIPIFLIGWYFLGKQEIINSLAGALLLPLAILLTKNVPPLKLDTPILASIFGGFICGLGLGIIFRANATTGGVDILARIIARKLGIPINRCILVFDCAIVLATGSIFGAESAMLAVLCVLSLSKAIDVVQSGLSSAKSITIITIKEKDMRNMLLEHLDCGATVIPASGAYSNTNKSLILTIVPRSKVGRLRRHIRQVDPEAFTVISNASEVLGYGFQNHG